jgi:FkbM family methyltransferase
MNLPPAIRRPLVRARRGLFEALGSARYSRLGLHGLDRKLERHLDFDGGVFVEAGANDGVEQSNTYYLEKFRGWTGLLVEPVPALAEACRRNRRVPVAEAALAAEEKPGATVEIHCAGLMSTVAGALGSAEATARHVALGLDVQPGLRGTRCERVPARTLSALLDETGITRAIDLLSLDVEGAEVAALRGIDYSRHAPRFICVEARDEAAIAAVLEPRYQVVEVLTDLGSHRDLLYARR